MPRTDGRVGLEMRAVIRQYQARNGLPVDGHMNEGIHKSVMGR